MTYDSLTEQYSVNKTQANRLSTDLISYFKSGDYSPPPIEEFNTRESSHIRDVKIVLHVLLAVYGALVLLILFLSLQLPITKLMIYGGGITVGGIALAAIIPFDPAFTFFHSLFFSAGTWTFPYNSILIRSYPQEFFMAFAVRILSLAASLGIVVMLAGFAARRYLKN